MYSFELLYKLIPNLFLKIWRWIKCNKILSFVLALYLTWWGYLHYLLHIYQKNNDEYGCLIPFVLLFLISAIVYLVFSIGFLLLVTFCKHKSGYEIALYITQIPIVVFLVKAII